MRTPPPTLGVLWHLVRCFWHCRRKNPSPCLQQELGQGSEHSSPWPPSQFQWLRVQATAAGFGRKSPSFPSVALQHDGLIHPISCRLGESTAWIVGAQLGHSRKGLIQRGSQRGQLRHRLSCAPGSVRGRGAGQPPSTKAAVLGAGGQSCRDRPWEARTLQAGSS